MKLALPIFICILLASCLNEGDCLISATDFMHIQFKKKSNHAIDTALILDYVSFVGTNKGYGKMQGVTELLLPIDVNSDTTTFAYQITSRDSLVQSNDTLMVSYSRQSKVISKDCGAYSFYSDLKILPTNISSSQIKAYSKSLIKDPTSSGTSAYAVNYQIYY